MTGIDSVSHVEIITCLVQDYDLQVAQLDFLPLGADPNSTVYRAVTSAGETYFVKVRRGDFNPMTLVVPNALAKGGGPQIIAPIATHTGALWTRLGECTVALLPFIAGEDGYAVSLTAAHWQELGRVFRSLHTLEPPSAWLADLPRETYADHWRQAVLRFLGIANTTTFADPVSAELATLLRQQHAVIEQVVAWATRCAVRLQREPRAHVLCHSDIHAGNVLVGADGQLYVIDWDTLAFAPKERDLMFVGAGLFAHHRPPQEEIDLFYAGYGPTQVDRVALAYYRCERVVQDIAAYCEQIWGEAESGDGRITGLRQLASQFRAHDVVELALQTAAQLPPEQVA